MIARAGSRQEAIQIPDKMIASDKIVTACRLSPTTVCAARPWPSPSAKDCATKEGGPNMNYFTRGRR